LDPRDIINVATTTMNADGGIDLGIGRRQRSNLVGPLGRVKNLQREEIRKGQRLNVSAESKARKCNKTNLS
jgi:hypothetical protein